MSEVCSKRGCENTRFKDDKYCILHCDKKDFEEQSDINLFWQKFREEYPYNTRDELIIENIKFPMFQMDDCSRGYLHSHRNLTYHENVKFRKCIFNNDFNSLYDRYSKALIFDSCVFFGNIIFRNSQKLELLYCEFKNEFIFENIECRNIQIKNSKFIKDIKLHSRDNLEISENTIFRNNVKLSSSNIQCQNSQFDKELTISNSNEVLLDDLIMKSNCFLQQVNDSVLKNITFQKEFTSEGLNTIKLEKININDLEFNGANQIEIFDSKISGILTFNKLLQKFIISNSSILKEIKALEYIANVEILNNTNIESSINLFGQQNHIDIQASKLKSLCSQSTNTISIDKSKCGILELLGEKIVNLGCSDSKIDSLNISVHTIEEIVFNDSRLKDLFLQSDINRLIELKNCSIENNAIMILKNLQELTFNKIFHYPTITIQTEQSSNVKVLESKIENFFINAFRDVVKNETMIRNKSVVLQQTEVKNYLAVVSSSELELYDCKIINYMHCDLINSILKIENSICNKIDFKNSNVNILNIKCSSFKDQVFFDQSELNQLQIIDTSFDKTIDFQAAVTSNITINKSIFLDEINFKENKLICLNKINNTKIQKLSICDTEVSGMFEKCENIEIEKLFLNNIKLQSNDATSDILVNNIKVDDLKCDKLTISQDMNFDDMMIEKLRISNSNIEKVLRIRYSKIEEIFFIDTTFEDLQIIDNKNDLEKETRGFRLKNTTIKSTVLDKLRLDNFNMSDAHVSDAKIGYVKFHQGSRETNRFFKNYYDSISDYIKANEYYKDEMEEQYKISKGSEKIVLFFNKHISNFGQSWLKPLGWILFFSIVFYSIINLNYFMIDGYILNHKWYIWNSFWQFLNPFAKNASQEYMDWYWLWMTHKLLLTAFIYHFVIAVKRRTKR